LKRPVSPLLHDYKSPARPEVALLLSLKSASGTNTASVKLDAGATNIAAESLLTVASTPEPANLSAPASFSDIEIERAPLPFPEFHPPLNLAPEYDQLHLTIKRGDTLDRLFRRNDLDLGHLAMIMKLPEAAPYLKKLIPGDELTIEHDEGNLISLYREINLTSAIKINKEASGQRSIGVFLDAN